MRYMLVYTVYIRKEPSGIVIKTKPRSTPEHIRDKALKAVQAFEAMRKQYTAYRVLVGVSAQPTVAYWCAREHTPGVVCQAVFEKFDKLEMHVEEEEGESFVGSIDHLSDMDKLYLLEDSEEER